MSNLELLKAMAAALKNGTNDDAFDLSALTEAAKAMDVVSEIRRADASAEAVWTDAAGQEWIINGHAMDLGNARVLIWTTTDEAGVDDVAVIDNDYETLEEVAEAAAEEIAGNLG